jgi:hypothetical protein
MQPQVNFGENTVADEDKLRSWLKKNAGARGFTIKTTDGPRHRSFRLTTSEMTSSEGA